MKDLGAGQQQTAVTEQATKVDKILEISTETGYNYNRQKIGKCIQYIKNGGLNNG